MACARVSGIRTGDIWWSDGVYSPFLHGPRWLSFTFPFFESLSACRSIPMLQHHIQALIRTHRLQVCLQLLGRRTRQQPSTRMHRDRPVSIQHTTRIRTPFKHRQHTIYIGLSALSRQVYSPTSALHTTSSYRMLSAKNYRKRPKLHVKF